MDWKIVRKEYKLIVNEKTELFRAVGNYSIAFHSIIDLSKIFDYCDPFDLIRWKRVSKQWNEQIANRFENILYLDLYRLDTRVLMEKLHDEDGELFAHPTAQILIQLGDRNATVVVHERWTSKDVSRLFELVKMFGAKAHTITVSPELAFSLILCNIRLISI
ncbi:unnamed protein product [Anisakis simplex]|uniref:F-box domain-containing protein n=1 Tax=Anisakis simplex TaxID=6269 RepID=A0A3P6NLP7_ANISI|nr:unnamed protein product [Anisakis simplex]